MKLPKYQHDLSLQSPILLDASYKQAKIEKMLSILQDAGSIQANKQTGVAIDVGCSGGLFVSALAPYFKSIIGMDIDSNALKIASAANSTDNTSYILADSLSIPLPNQSVDLIICNHVYEHVPNATLLFAEIFRVLTPKGICYFGAASRLVPVEPHYHLPLLSWLPKPLAHRYMRITRKGDYYYEKLRSYWGIKALIRQFDIIDYTLAVVSDPDRFKARDMIPKNGLIDKIPLFIWKSLYWILPGYIFILRKPQQ